MNAAQVKFVLVETSSGGNIGAAARAMKTMGLSDLALVNPCEFRTYECYSRASGADDLLDSASVCATLEEAIADCTLVIGTSARLRTLSWPQIEPHEIVQAFASSTVADTDEQIGRLAIVFGRERSGLTNAELALCSQLVVIPSMPQFSSLNISAAVQVLAYELRRGVLAQDESLSQNTGQNTGQNTASKLPPGELPATHDEHEHLYAHMQSTMIETGYLDPENPRMMMPRMRRLFNRAAMNRSEVQLLRGLLASLDKLAKKIKSEQ